MSTINFNLAKETLTSNSGIVQVGNATGALKVGTGTGISATSGAGVLRYNAGNLEVSNGSAWLVVTTSSGGTSGISGEDAFAIAVALS